MYWKAKKSAKSCWLAAATQSTTDEYGSVEIGSVPFAKKSTLSATNLVVQVVPNGQRAENSAGDSSWIQSLSQLADSSSAFYQSAIGINQLSMKT